MPVLTPTGMAAGCPILTPDMFGPQDIRGVGFLFAVVPGPTGTALVGDGLRPEAADEWAGASAMDLAAACMSSISAVPRRTIIFRRDRFIHLACFIPFWLDTLPPNRSLT